MRVVLIGAGLSSALTCLILRQHYGDKVKLVVFEKDKHIGGRMITTYEGEEKNSTSLDLGFQYLAVTQTNPVTSKFFQQWTNDHVLEVLEREGTVGLRYKPNITDYSAPNGITSFAEYLFQRAGAEIHLSKQITKIDLNSSNDKFSIFSNDDKLDESAVVIVTIPVPQLLAHLKGSIAQLIEHNRDVKEKLAQVNYYSRFALGLFYPPSMTNLNLSWRIYSVDEKESDVLRIIVVDNWKRNRSEPPFAVVTHTSVEYAAQHLKEDAKVVGEQMKEELFKLVPDLPRDISSAKYDKYEYCQIEKPYPGAPGYLVLHEHPCLMLTGDSFVSTSLVESHIEAAIKTVERIVSAYP